MVLSYFKVISVELVVVYVYECMSFNKRECTRIYQSIRKLDMPLSLRSTVITKNNYYIVKRLSGNKTSLRSTKSFFKKYGRG